MNILLKLIEKIRNIFSKKEEVLMLQEGNQELNNQGEKFRDSIKVYVEKINKKVKQVETHICYGDGLGIKNKIEY